jgi:hypothetical protein
MPFWRAATKNLSGNGNLLRRRRHVALLFCPGRIICARGADGIGQIYLFFRQQPAKIRAKTGKIDKNILIQFFNVKTVDIKENP